MKKIVYYLMFIILMFPTIIFASSTYDNGVDMANKYIYDFQDYARYIKITGELPYGVNASNKPEFNASFKTGGFLNEKEYLMSINNSASWLAPGIGYWLIGNKILDVRVSASVNANVVSGVRVTEFVKHDAKVKGNGTKTNPWYFTDGYIVKIGSSDLSLGTVTGNCEHVAEGGSCRYTLTYDTKIGVDINNCKKTVESKGATLNLNGNILTISNVKSDISCFVDFGTNVCTEVSFNNNGGSGGMTTPIYYKYGYGWFSDALCLNKVASVSKPAKAGHAFNGYKYNGITIIDAVPKIAASVRENITGKKVTATADWTVCPAGTYASASMTACASCPVGTYSGAQAASCTNCAAGTYQPNTRQSSCIPCVVGSTSAEKATACTACQGKTTTAAGSASCNKNCDNAANVASWKTATWNTNNTVSNLCVINTCAPNYKIENGVCKIMASFAFNYTGSFTYKEGNGGEVGASNRTVTLMNPTWQVKFLSNGTLTVYGIGSNIDAFLVGGGGGAGGCNTTRGGGGGGGGFTTTQTNFALGTTSYYISIGGGGGCGGRGGTSSAFNLSAAGGYAGNAFSGNGAGGAGGSGGGGTFGGNDFPSPEGTGGSNGSSGQDGKTRTNSANGNINRTSSGGSGCSSNGGCKINGRTCYNTSAFCENGNEVFAGGGAGSDHEYCGVGGAGGGGGSGRGGWCVCGCPGRAQANKGGGGASNGGSSGIVIIRNKR